MANGIFWVSLSSVFFSKLDHPQDDKVSTAVITFNLIITYGKTV